MILEDLFSLLNGQKSFQPFQLHRGEIFSAVEDSEGGIGIAASPDFPDDSAGAEDYLKSVIMQCRINARINQLRHDLTDVSFIHSAKFQGNEKIVMAGFIRPVYEQLLDAGLSCHVFDLTKEAYELLPLEEMDDYLCEADVLICTGTAFSNGSIDAMFQKLKTTARLYIIGPSAPLAPVLFDWIPSLQGIFGSVVKTKEILPKIDSGAGRRQLHEELQKVALLRSATSQDRS